MSWEKSFVGHGAPLDASVRSPLQCLAVTVQILPSDTLTIEAIVMYSLYMIIEDHIFRSD